MAICFPIPLPPPVTTTTVPANSEARLTLRYSIINYLFSWNSGRLVVTRTSTLVRSPHQTNSLTQVRCCREHDAKLAGAHYARISRREPRRYVRQVLWY